MADIVMPRLSDTMEDGTILRWLKADGDTVRRGEELVEIETDKAAMTYESDQDGVLSRIAAEGDTLPVGEVIARVAADGDVSAAAGAAAEAGATVGEAGEAGAGANGDAAAATVESIVEIAGGGASSPAPAAAPTATGARVKASPLARRIAEDRGVDLHALAGSGPGGRIVKADVEAAAKGGEKKQDEKAEKKKEPEREEKRAPAPAGDSGRGEIRHQDLTRLQRTVARRMAESKATAPDFVISLEVDMEEAVALRKQLKAAAGDGPAPSFNDFVVKACALALRDFPRANGAYRDGAFELYSRVNVGVAVAGQDALVVPTVFDADKKSLGTIAGEARALAEKVREGKITPPELSAGTFTVSNLGMYGIRRFVAVINPPQAAILAVGELTPRPVVRDGEVTVRAIMDLTLSCDHRILYGADAAEFLARIREYLETPLKLAL
jgi:pyruvate dehydrogenase E2 component (dihydrolipoamide acetyltransferase)